MKMNREELLTMVGLVLPGTSEKDNVEQSSCVIFKDDYLHTYNDEVSCSLKAKTGISGAVKAKPLVSVLQRMTENEVDIEVGEGELLIRGKRRRCGIRMESEILLPIESIKPPKEWKKIDEKLIEAIGLVSYCAGKETEQFALSCVHITSEYVEAMDNFQLGKYKVFSDIEKSILIRRDSLKSILTMGAIELGETKNWIHFRNKKGLIVSCRRYIDEFPKTKALFKVKGSKLLIPKGIRTEVELAEIFSSENDNSMIEIHLTKDNIKVMGRGDSGYYTVDRKTKYKGEIQNFRMPPKLLCDLSRKYHSCVIGPDRLKIKSGNMLYVTVLNTIVEKE